VSALYQASVQTIIKNASKGLVAHYTFEEGTGTATADKTGNGNTGTLANGPLWSGGKFGKGISFDGSDDYVDTGAFTLPSNVSFCAWIKPNSLPGAYKFFMGSDNATGNSGIGIATDSSNQFYVAIKDGYRTAILHFHRVWYHVWIR
jgi:hypothetical protein